MGALQRNNRMKAAKSFDGADGKIISISMQQGHHWPLSWQFTSQRNGVDFRTSRANSNLETGYICDSSQLLRREMEAWPILVHSSTSMSSHEDCFPQSVSRSLQS